MNTSIIRFILLYVVGFIGLFLLLPVIVALIYHENVWSYYLVVAMGSVCANAGVVVSPYP